jgi:hypothetical protein
VLRLPAEEVDRDFVSVYHGNHDDEGPSATGRCRRVSGEKTFHLIAGVPVACGGLSGRQTLHKTVLCEVCRWLPGAGVVGVTLVESARKTAGQPGAASVAGAGVIAAGVVRRTRPTRQSPL